MSGVRGAAHDVYITYFGTSNESKLEAERFDWWNGTALLPGRSGRHALTGCDVLGGLLKRRTTSPSHNPTLKRGSCKEC